MVKSIFISAGEASGDLLGANLIKALRNLDDSVTIQGIAGARMQAKGVNSLFPQEDLSVMGLIEVLPKLFLIAKRFYQTVDHILQTTPEIIITIDAPAFNLRLAKKLRKKGYTGKIIHYVAPSVWAWKEKRAKKMVGYFDHVLCLFPFEPPYFEKYGLNATFVGHPLADQLELQPRPIKKTLLLLPGSRKTELKALSKIFITVAKRLQKEIPDLEVVVPTFERFLSYFEGHSFTLLTDKTSKGEAFKTATLALAASGTVTLELGLLGVPMVTAYKIHPLTHFIVKLLVKTKFASLVNILLEKPVVPELLQYQCTEENIYNEVVKLYKDSTIQQQEFQKLHAFFDKKVSLGDFLKTMLLPSV